MDDEPTIVLTPGTPGGADDLQDVFDSDNIDQAFEQDDGWDETLAEINLNMLPNAAVPPQPTSSTGNSYRYQDVNIQFPYKAYRSQQLMMEKIVEGLKTGENCLLESPTGTGKTAALLCALLGWQKDCKDRNDNCSGIIQASAEARFGGCSCGLIVDKEHTSVILSMKDKKEWCLRSYTPKYEDLEEEIDSFEFDTSTASNIQASGLDPPTTPKKFPISTKASPAASPCPTTPTRNSSLASPSSINESPAKRQRRCEMIEIEKTFDEACGYCLKKNVYDRSRPPKIYYCTRTHSQIVQVVKQLKATAYRTAKMTILASRVPTCISENALNEVRNRNTKDEGQGPSQKININDVCREWKKNYFKIKKLKDGLEEAETAASQSQATSNPNNPSAIEDLFKLPVCKYFRPPHESASDFSSLQRRGAFDFEDIKEEGQCIGSCPYFGCSALQTDADIIFGSYNYLVDPSLRKGQGIKYINNVLVFDEAHNIEDICRDAFSFKIDLESFKKDVLGLVTNLLELVNDPSIETSVNGAKISALRELRDRFTKWVRYITDIGLKLAPLNYKFDKKAPFESDKLQDILSAMEMDIDGVDRCLELASLAGAGPTGKSTGFDDDDEDDDYYYNARGHMKKFKLSSTVIEFLKTMRQSLVYLCEEEKDGVGGVKDFKGYLTRFVNPKPAPRQNDRVQVIDPTWSEFNFIFQIICLNPAIGFRELRNAAFSIIVASGTLTPLASFSSELACKFAVTLQAEHVIPKSNVWAGVISVGPNNVKLRLVKDKQDDLSIQDEVGNILCQICDSIPNGVLVFLPSYSFMNKLKARWQNFPARDPVFRRIGKKKKIFFEESKDKKLFKEQMDTYKVEVKGGLTWNGCVLFAVFRGKISEGIDFADEQARCVVTIGIPFSNIGAADVKSKKEYNDMRQRTKKPGEMFLSGKDWYQTQAFRAMNQGFGRCVRHREDWGAVVMIDSRIGEKQYESYVSAWIQKNLKVYNDFNVVKVGLQRFVRARTEQDSFRRRRSVCIQYEADQSSNQLDDAEVVPYPNDSNGSYTANGNDIQTQVVGGANFVHHMLTQRIHQLSSPVAASTPLRQPATAPDSSPEYSFSQEVDEIMGLPTQVCSSQVVVDREEERVDETTQMENGVHSDGSAHSSPSIYGRSPSPPPSGIPRVVSYGSEVEMSFGVALRREFDGGDPVIVECDNRDGEVNHILDVSMASQDSHTSSVSYHSSEDES